MKGCTTDIKSPDVTKSETSNWGRGDPRDIHKQLQIVRSTFIDYAHNVARRLYVDINFYLLVALKVKVKVHTLDIAPLRSESPPRKRSGMARVFKGFHSLSAHPHFHPQSE